MVVNYSHEPNETVRLPITTRLHYQVWDWAGRMLVYLYCWITDGIIAVIEKPNAHSGKASHERFPSLSGSSSGCPAFLSPANLTAPPWGRWQSLAAVCPMRAANWSGLRGWTPSSLEGEHSTAGRDLQVLLCVCMCVCECICVCETWLMLWSCDISFKMSVGQILCVLCRGVVMMSQHLSGRVPPHKLKH